MHANRIAKVQKLLADQGVDSLLLSNPFSIYYLTGFIGLAPEDREAFAIVTKKRACLIASPLYTSNYPDTRYLSSSKRLSHHLLEIVKEDGLKTLGVESEDIKVGERERLLEALPNIHIQNVGPLVEKIREVKDADEIQKIREACKLSDQCLKDVSKGIKIGKTEGEIAFAIESWIQSRGYTHAFYPIVAIDKNSAIPHHNSRGSSARVKKRSTVLIDMGVAYKNYHSDITRMFFVGEPDQKVRKIYEALNTAQDKTIGQVTAGAVGREVDGYCRKLLTADLLPTYPHVTGHGVGLEIHENPRVTLKSEDVLEAGNVITIEPGVYYEGKFGMRIEDTVLVTEKGYEVLTQYPKEFIKAVLPAE